MRASVICALFHAQSRTITKDNGFGTAHSRFHKNKSRTKRSFLSLPHMLTNTVSENKQLIFKFGEMLNRSTTI